MANEGGEWIMKGLDWDNPWRLADPFLAGADQLDQ